MRLTLVAATLAVLMMTACGKPNQALPEQEKANFSKIISQQGAPRRRLLNRVHPHLAKAGRKRRKIMRI